MSNPKIEDNRTMLEKFTLDALWRKISIFIDIARGLDFLSCVAADDIGFDPMKVHHYAPSGDRYLSKVLRKIKINKNDSILDIGCGKGSAMRAMLGFPFSRVHGIEISDILGSVAVNNFNKLKAFRAKIFVSDAVEFREYQNYNFFYFYNPFPDEIMVKVIDNIVNISRDSKEERIIIYNNPVCHNIIKDTGVFFKLCEFPDEWGNKIFVYFNFKKEDSRLHELYC